MQYKPIPILNIGPLFPNPKTMFEGNNISSLELFIPERDVLAKYSIKQEFHEHRVMNGLSTLGGLWTFLSGIFAVISGTSILLIMFGMTA